MSQKWHQKASVQAAIISGTFLILAAIVTGVFVLFRDSRQREAAKETKSYSTQDVLLKIISEKTLSEYVPSDTNSQFHPERVGSYCSYSTVSNTASTVYAKGVSFTLLLQHLSKSPNSAIIKRLSAVVEKYIPVADIDYVYPEPACVHPLLIEPTHVLMILYSKGQDGSVWIPRDRDITESNTNTPMPKDHWEWFPWYKEGMTTDDVMGQRLGRGANIVINGDNALGEKRLIKLVPNSSDDVEVLAADIIGAEGGYYEFRLEITYDLGGTTATLRTDTYRIFHNPKF